MGRFNDGPRSGGFRRFDNGPSKKWKAVCSECKQECEVPFEPTEGRPVFCSECWKKRKPRF